MERCPCCQSRLRGAAHCPRCQADLTWVIRSERLSEDWLACAVQAWDTGDSDLCVEALSRSLRLKTTPTALLFRDFVIRRQLPRVFQRLLANDVAGARRQAAALHRLDTCNILLGELRAFVSGMADDQ